MTWKFNDEIIDESEIYDIVHALYSYDDYDQYLDDTYGTIWIGDLSYNASHLLKNVDKIAYEIGYNEEVEYIANEIIDDKEPDDWFRFGIEYIDD